MQHQVTRSVLAFVPDALSASQVGTWTTDVINDRTVCDAAAAALFGVDPNLAAEGLPLAAYARVIHPDDRAGFHDKLNRVREHGGLFVVEYRAFPAPGDRRWVLARGRYERDDRTGGMTGRGIVIDITESKLDGRAEDRAFFIAEEDTETPLERAAACAIQTRQAIDEFDGPEGLGLRRSVDALLLALGRALARRVGASEP
ncbi:PAS domain-containing protein [Methylobacterium platani]|uniref:Diguanylate cyclase n=2 Tax=Methylobacterium platani TaxID=427683 RepID=A0A179SEZ3_9HYPH|nr:PAS domain-containing protein [Methylobacterium platani]KMO11901.1 diguanylate cyclase [Methylobacterium platani JCM 14648]OAS26007.1 diguanylate cyclase [Methylobacterium platani]